MIVIARNKHVVPCSMLHGTTLFFIIIYFFINIPGFDYQKSIYL